MSSVASPIPAREHVPPGCIMRVSSSSDPSAVGGAISHVYRRDGAVELSVIGAGALNQAIKAVAIAAIHLAEEARPVALIPTFETVLIAGSERTSIRLRVVPRDSALPSIEDLTDLIVGELRAHPELRDFTDSLYASTLAERIVTAVGS